MNKGKIQYKNYQFAKTLNEYLKRDTRDPEALLLKIAKKYNLLNPLVTNIGLSYDTLEVTLYSLEKDVSLYISIGFLETDPISVRILGKNYVTTFYLEDDVFTLNKITYEGLHGETLIKHYTTTGKSKALIIDKNNQYFKYRYDYKNVNLNTVITIQIPKDSEFKEATFLKAIISNHNILDLDVLYKEIKRQIISDKFSISIRNEINGKENEQITVLDGELLEYKKYKSKDEKEEFYKFLNGKLVITRLEDANKNYEFQKVLKMI